MNEDRNTTILDHVGLARFKRRITAWVVSLFSNITATADNTHSSSPTVTPTYSNGVLTLAFSGLQGAAGATGADGTSAYLFIRYYSSSLANDNVTEAHTSPQTGDKYIGIGTSSTNTYPGNTSLSWMKFVGEDGQNGTSVTVKPDAASCTQVGDAYIDQDSSSQTYGHLLILTNTNPTTWFDAGEIKGPKGDTGDPGQNGTSEYLHIRYYSSSLQNDNVTEAHTSPQTGDKWIGIGSTTSSTYPGNTALSWWKFVGEDGQNGTNGTNGTDGQDGADGATWYTINSSTVLIGTTPNTAYSAPAGKTYKVGDMYLNYYNWNIYECVTAGVGTAAVFYYKGNIKGAQGQQGIQGPQGPAGQDGGIVSKAYRFSNTLTLSKLTIGQLSGDCYIYSADARITINKEDGTANLHLSMLCQFDGEFRWNTACESLDPGAFGIGSSLVFKVAEKTENIQSYLINEGYVVKIPKSGDAGMFYGVMNIRHYFGWYRDFATAESDNLFLLDIHGLISTDTDYNKIFADGMSFDLTLE